MEEQVCTIEQMEKLKELGINISKASMHFLYMPTAESIMRGVYEVDKEPSVFVSQKGMNHEYPTFTVQDILELLPYTFDDYYLKIYRGVDIYYFMYEDMICGVDIIEKGNNLIQAAYNMLVYIAENKLLNN